MVEGLCRLFVRWAKRGADSLRRVSMQKILLSPHFSGEILKILDEVGIWQRSNFL